MPTHCFSFGFKPILKPDLLLTANVFRLIVVTKHLEIKLWFKTESLKSY